MVALEAPKLRALQHRLGAAAERVEFADMGDIGHNPACIIPAWRDFVGRPLRPDARRRRADLARPHAPTSSSSASATRRCSTPPSPTPTASTCCAPTTRVHLDREVIEEAERSHPWVGAAESVRYRGRPTARRRSSPSRSRPRPASRPSTAILWDTLGSIRALVAEHARPGRRLRAARRRPRARHPRGRDQQHPPRRRRGHPARLARPRHRGLRGQRPRPPRPAAGRPRPPGARLRGRLGPVAGQPALRPRPDPHAARAATSCGCTCARSKPSHPRARCVVAWA